MTFGDFGWHDIFTAKTLNFPCFLWYLHQPSIFGCFHQGTALHQMARRHSPLPFHPHTLKPDKSTFSGPISSEPSQQFYPKMEDWKIRHDQIILNLCNCFGTPLVGVPSERNKHHLLQWALSKNSVGPWFQTKTKKTRPKISMTLPPMEHDGTLPQIILVHLTWMEHDRIW